MKPPDGAGPRTCPVDLSRKSRVMSAPSASGVGPVVTVKSGLCWLNAMNRGTSPGRSAKASSSIWSSGMPLSAEGTPSRIAS